MKINKEELKDIIRDEILKYFTETDNDNKEVLELASCHSPETGHFSKCDKQSVYSLSDRAAREHGIDKKFVGRGTVKSKKDREPPKLKTPFGLNTSKDKQGGRQTIKGKAISPKHSVSKYPEKYYKENQEASAKTQRQRDVENCRRLGFRSAQEIIDRYLRSVSKAQAAADGEYPKPEK